MEVMEEDIENFEKEAVTSAAPACRLVGVGRGLPALTSYSTSWVEQNYYTTSASVSMNI